MKLTIRITVEVDPEAIAEYLETEREITPQDAINVLEGSAISNWQYDHLVTNQAIIFEGELMK